MSSVASYVKSIIERDGPISVARFVELSLSGRPDSYYMNRDPLGIPGDFITSPEISQVFGECIGVWCVDLWLKLGSPPSFRLVELGPGRGTLMQDILRAGKVGRSFLEACAVSFVEINPVLRALQARSVGMQAPASVEWVEHFGAVGIDRPLIVIANEFFDALPARQLLKRQDAWLERMVGLNGDGAFVFTAADGPDLSNLVPISVRNASSGSIWETSQAALDIADAIGRALGQFGGALLAIDYGHAGPSIGDTFQAVKAHQRASVLQDAGECDLTFHVDFAALVTVLKASGARCFPVVEQRHLLARLGAFERTRMLQRNADAEQGARLDRALHRLTSPSGMGTLFRALCAASPASLAPAGFSD